MPTTTPLQGWPIPTLTDIPNGPAQMQALGNAAEKQSVMSFPDTTTRDQTVTNPVEGMICWVGGTRDTMMFYNDGQWNDFVPYSTSTGGIGSGPPAVIGKQMTRVSNYGEQATLSDGKFNINLPGGFVTLVSVQITAANRGVPNLANGWIPVILTASSSGSNIHIQARDFDGSIIASKFVGYIYEAVVQ